ncbi:hypothetical protein RB195_021128 [Necator americanus]
MLCPLKPKATVNVARYPKLTEHLAWATDYREASRLQEYDEMWSVRWARHVVYGRSEATVTSTLPGPDTNDERYAKWTPPSLLSSLPICGVVCITLLPTSRTIHTAILPSPVFSFQPFEQKVNEAFLQSDNMASTVCKSLFEDGELGLGIRRKEAGPWQTRKQLGDRLIAVATQVILNNSVPDESYLELRFDHALLLQIGHSRDRKFSCARGEKSGWQLIPYHSYTPFPYFLGCRQNWRFTETQLIECFENKLPPLRKKSRSRREHNQGHSRKNR